jgi:hypothetical protein
MDALGIECVVLYRGEDERIVRHGGGEPVQRNDFIREQFEKARKR